MQSKTISCSSLDELLIHREALSQFHADVIIVYASASFFDDDRLFATLLPFCSNLLGCSAAGEISGEQVRENSISIILWRFQTDAHAKIYTCELAGMQASKEVGVTLANQIQKDSLRGVYILSPGVNVNGSALVDGLRQKLPQQVGISGGLAGDGDAFEKTFVMGPNGISNQQVVALALYGDKLDFDYAALAGWRSFGPTRLVTKATENQLYELDYQSALDIYKKYLGEYAEDLPASGLLFPFEVIDSEGRSVGIIRTILGVDERQQSLTLAGEVHEGQYVRLMHASTDDLIDGASHASMQLPVHRSASAAHNKSQDIALITSCVGRKLVMGDRVEEEIEEVVRCLPENVKIAGFYSYGEMSPFNGTLHSQLHNQTLTIMLLRERI